MLVEEPHIAVVHAYFDQLLDKVFPAEFGENWWNLAFDDEKLVRVHEFLSGYFSTLLPLPYECEDRCRTSELTLCTHGFHFPLPDSSEKEKILLKLVTIVKDYTNPPLDLNPVIENAVHWITSHYAFNPVQAHLLVQNHLVVNHLIWQFHKNEKYGRDFFRTAYAVDLIGSFFPGLTPNQARRFYYWGLLKFRVSDDLKWWYTPDTFREYLAKFAD
jgi:hypothetical protein